MASKSVRRKVSIKEYVVATMLTFLVIWLVFLNISIFHKEEIARKAARATQEELSSLDAREKTLQSNINELGTERGQEATLRDTFGVARPGEGVIIVVPTHVATTTPPLTFWQRWFGWLPSF